jgi:hypothetical protein
MTRACHGVTHTVTGPRRFTSEVAKRSLMLVDRESGRGAAVVFCETEVDLRAVDEFMNNMSPPSGTGTRSSVELYEVAVDSDQL